MSSLVTTLILKQMVIWNLCPYGHFCDDVTSNVALQREEYRHSFYRPERLIVIITNLNILYIILLSTKFWTCVYKIRQYRANYIGSDLLTETHALTSKCHVPCYAKHHSAVVKRRYFRCAQANFLAIFDNHSINFIV